MKIILFLLLIISLTLPLNVNAENPTTKYHTVYPMEDKIRGIMDETSKMPETIQNAEDYWCLNYYLNLLTKSVMVERNMMQEISEERLSGVAMLIKEKYSDDDNFLLFSNTEYNYTISDYDKPYLRTTYDNFTNTINVDVNGHNPLKMIKAQEILTGFDNVILEAYVTPEHTNDIFSQISCNVVDDYDLKVADNPISNAVYKQFINLRGELVTVKIDHVNHLFKRGYLIGQPSLSYLSPEFSNIKFPKSDTRNTFGYYSDVWKLPNDPISYTILGGT